MDEPNETSALAGLPKRERLGIRAIALLADKKLYSASQAMSAMADDGRLWLGCTIEHVRSGTGALSPYWVVPVAPASRAPASRAPACEADQPVPFGEGVMSRALRSFVGFEGKRRGLYIAYACGNAPFGMRAKHAQ